MEPKMLYRFVEEVAQQCRFARIAFRGLQNEILAMENEKVFFHVHAFLSHAGNIVRLLWPARQSSLERGEKLRGELKPADELAHHLKEVRAQLECYDERYEDWLASVNECSYVDMNVMPRGTMEGFKEDVFQRSLDPENYKLEFRGARCDLKLIYDEIKRLEASSNGWLRSHSPW